MRGAVFARMSPEQKQALVERLQELGYYVGEILNFQILSAHLIIRVLQLIFS